MVKPQTPTLASFRRKGSLLADYGAAHRVEKGASDLLGPELVSGAVRSSLHGGRCPFYSPPAYYQ